MTNSTKLYDRSYRLIVGGGSGAGDTSSTNATVITELQLTFKITRSVKASEDKCEISVYNLSEASRTKFFQKDKLCQLDVAYDGGELRTIFRGNIGRISTERSGQDFVTKIIIADGGETIRESVSERSFAPGVTVGEAMRTVVTEDMKLPFVSTNGQLPAGEGLDRVLQNGVSISAKSHPWLTKTAEANNINFFIQDGKAYSVPIQYSRPTTVVPLYTPETGLIGSPQAIIPKKKKGCLDKDPESSAGTKFVVLLDPSLQVGGRVKIKSKDIDGVFKLVEFCHKGDFRGNDWYSECEANITGET